MPIEITEWNLKCWGERRKMLGGKNLEFEEGVDGWEQQVDRRSGSIRALSGAGRHGKGIRMVAVKEYTRPESGHGSGRRTSGAPTCEASSSGLAAGHRPTALAAPER